MVSTSLPVTLVLVALIGTVAAARQSALSPAPSAPPAVTSAKHAAVMKIAKLLEDLKSKVMTEGEKEAASYDKFSCFCSDTSAEKTEAIREGSDNKAELEASIGELRSNRQGLDSEIADIEKSLKEDADSMAKAKSQREEELAEYAKNEADLTGALQALEGAIKTLKASAKPSFLEVSGVAKDVSKALLLADALGLAGEARQTASTFLQAPEVPMQDYNFHSHGIVEALEVLRTSFSSEKVELDKAEAAQVHAHQLLMQELSDHVKANKVELADRQKEKEQTQADIAARSERLTTVSAVLADDQQYLAELSKMCSEKAQTWDTRSKMRQDELSALTAAIGIVKNTVSAKTSASTIRFAQQASSVDRAEAVVRSPAAMEAVEMAAEEAEAPSFVQASLHRSLAPAVEEERQAVLSLLRSRAGQLKSTVLSSLVSQIAADPFAKVKTLIQELIERLLKQASNEANQKGWCDKATSDATQKRDYADQEVRRINGELAELEASHDKVSQELADLTAAIEELEASRAKESQLREEERKENAFAVAEAQGGLEGVQAATSVLSKYYATAAKASVSYSLSQASPLDDAPDAGFDNGQAYVGSQGEAGGILGMLDVIASDFKRTITETQQSEAQAEQAFLEFTTETGKSLAAKSTAKGEVTSQKDSLEEELESSNENLSSQSEVLLTAIKELLELKPACIDTGMSYEERVARRKDEIEALKTALCVLEHHDQGSTDQC
eukprot:CAMPEP_0170596152 /NCGR_PEP_ID=MMETSP0224-20130122/14954_1 /TAXON_ID=285029 /ORGANISM="Togula jolla, Strain CCCM 725" /LENGTH=729 /DNA_ID=CAMNT_0010920403 /DNA_START=41 /DNA_END=2230 /DNA_ORIENTATION=-